MKKKLFAITVVAMLTVAAAWNVNIGKSGITLSEVTLDNVEALARGEGDCPNGCVANGRGCYCNGSYPSDREAG